jgi:hypothetical protein
MLNLEPLAALAANNMADHRGDTSFDAENMITKSVAILCEQGVYAFGLFLSSRKKRDMPYADRIHEEAIRLLLSANLATKEQLHAGSRSEIYKSLTAQQSGETPAEALRRILLSKQLLETSLTYGRYAAKALKSGD